MNKILNSFIERSDNIHSYKYDYSKVVYKNTYTKIIIICPIHGDFLQIPKNHQKGHGCPKCAVDFKSKLLSNGINEFISKSISKHGDRYDYSKSIYINNKTKLSIICKEHGEYMMSPSHHYNGHGCSSCSNNYRKTNEEFINLCNILHSDKYLYNLTNYKSNKKKIIIICKEHGEFSQNGGHHLMGHGCPICSSSQGENYIKNFLNENSIEYIREKTFENCKSLKGYKLRFDFYIPRYNMCIEYDGLQHFEPIEYFGGETKFIELKTNDEIKNKYCLENNIEILRIKYIRPSEKNKNIIEKILKQKIKTNMENKTN